MKKHLLFAAILAMLPMLCSADGNTGKVVEKPLVAQSLDSFKQESAWIRNQMEAGGQYEFIKSGDKSRVETGMSTIERVLANHAGNNDLSTADKITIVNAQSEVNGILKHNDVNRLVCESRAPVGSHIPVNTCRTFGEIETQRRGSLDQLNDLNNQSRLNKHSN